MKSWIKELAIMWLVTAKKPVWKSNDKLKVVISVNQYFSLQRWHSFFSETLNKEANNWEIVYCKNRLDAYRHFPDANICLLFGLGDYLLNKLDTPKMIYFPFIGLDFIYNKTIPKTITIEQPPSYSAQTIAEYCIAMSIILTRNLHNSFKNQFSKNWKQTNIIPESTVSILTCKIGVLGLGKIGKEIAIGFRKIGCKVVGCDKTAPKNSTFLSAFYQSAHFYEFINSIDILILALPLDVTTKHIIDEKALKALGPHKYVINVSRGEIIDEQALIEALSTNALKGAVLDVFESEPLSKNSRLYQCRNIIITPHIAGNANLFVNEIQQDFLRKAIIYKNNV